MISRRVFLRDMLGVIGGAGVLALPVWRWLGGRQVVSRFSRPMMGTRVEMALVGMGVDAGAVAGAAFSVMAETADRLSVFEESSPLSRLNATAGRGPVPIDSDLEAVLTMAERVRASSQGAFTAAILPLSSLWRPSRGRRPAPELVEAGLAAVRESSIRLGAGFASLGAATRLDLGGIAKGYVVDRGMEVLRRAGVTSAVVDAGGDLRLLGRMEGRPWRVGIPDPGRPDAIAKILELDNVAVATSGDYQRYFTVDGVRYHHIVDPRTGYPAQGSPSFTAVIPGDDMVADAASTAGLVLGAEAGLDWAESLGIGALAVDGAGRWRQTPSLAVS